MQALTSLFSSNAAGIGSFAEPGTISAGTGAGSGGLGTDQLFGKAGSSQAIPFVGPVVSVFQAFKDEKDARRTASRIDFNARAEELFGKQQTIAALRLLNEVQANNVVAAFTSGGGLAGSRGRVAQDVNREAQLGFDLIRTNAEIKSADLRQKARIIRRVARFDRNAVIAKSLFSFGASAAGA